MKTIFTLWLLFSAATAWAALGDLEVAVESDRLAMAGTQKVTSGKIFTIHEISTSNGVTMKEYAGPDGHIFAVTWRGTVHPDLKLILGSYVGEYQQQLNVKPHKYGHGHEMIKTPNIVFEHGGHMRDVRGRAFLPSMIPTGVAEGDIQ